MCGSPIQWPFREARRSVAPSDDAANRSIRVQADPRTLEPQAIDCPDVTTGPRQRDRAMWRSAIEILAGRSAALSKHDLVVPTPQQPRVSWERVSEGAHACDQRIEASDASKIENAGEQLTNLPDVRVRIVEARHESAPAQIDALRPRIRRIEHGVGLAHCRDATVTYADSTRDPEARLREHRPAVEDNIKHVSAAGRRKACPLYLRK
jgi:hypothetical protein